MPYATLFLTNVIKFSVAMHIKHPCGCTTIATTYTKVKSTPTTESGDRQLLAVTAAKQGRLCLEGKRVKGEVCCHRWKHYLALALVKRMKNSSYCLEAKYLQHLTSRWEDDPTLSLAGFESQNPPHLPEINWYVCLPRGDTFQMIFLPWSLFLHSSSY